MRSMIYKRKRLFNKKICQQFPVEHIPDPENSASNTIINGYLPCNEQCLRKGMEESTVSNK